MRELAEKLHVRRLSIQKWVEAGLLHRKRNGRMDEASLQSFLYSHPEYLKWPLFDEDTAFLDFGASGSREGEGQRR